MIAPWPWKRAGSQAGALEPNDDAAGESGGFYVAPEGGAWPRCYLKPTKKGAPGAERAAREKLASDLAFDLGLHVPAVLLTSRDAPADQERHVCLSAVQYPHQWSWSQISEHMQLSPASTISAMARPDLEAVAAAAWVFDTWVGQREHDEHPHNIVWGYDSSLTASGFVFLDYATSFGWGDQWRNRGWLNLEAARIPALMLATIDSASIGTHLDRLEAVADGVIRDLVERIPADFLSDEQHALIVEGLIGRRPLVRQAIAPYLNK